MGQPALIASQSGRVTPGLPALVTASGGDSTATVVTERAEDGQYYLSPATLEEVEQRASALDDDPLTLVVDGTPHPGQLVDLQARLESLTVVDRRRAVWERLADTNPVADARVALRRARLDRRRVANAQRDAATEGPSGTSGALAESETRLQRLRDALEREQESARRRVRTSHTGADARVVLVGRVGAPTTALWATLTGQSATPAPGEPTRPRTATTDIGPHTLAVTDTPGIPGTDGLPDWLTAVVPGLVTAFKQARCALVVGEQQATLGQAVARRFDLACRSLDEATPTAVQTAVADCLGTVTYAVRLPYTDEAHALVAALHDEATVSTVEYEDAIYLRLEAPRAADSELRRRISAAGGETKPLDADG